MKQSIILSALVMMFFTSCEDFFQTTVEIELPEHEERLSYSGFAYLLNDSLNISHVISHSQKILANTPVNIENGKFVMKSNESVLIDETLLSFQQTYQPTNMPLEPGNQYDIEVSADGWESIRASQVLPKPVEIESVDFDENGAVDEFGEPADAYTVRFKDDANEENYYFVSGESKVVYSWFDGQDTIREENIQPLYFSSTDPTVTSMWNFDGVALSDAAFNGKDYALRLASYSGFGGDFAESSEVKVRLFSLTKEAYSFLVSLQAYSESDGNPFSEPVVVFQNIENGFGIFALANATEIEVEF